MYPDVLIGERCGLNRLLSPANISCHCEQGHCFGKGKTFNSIILCQCLRVVSTAVQQILGRFLELEIAACAVPRLYLVYKVKYLMM